MAQVDYVYIIVVSIAGQNPILAQFFHGIGKLEMRSIEISGANKFSTG